MEATKQNVPVALLIYAVQGGSDVWFCGWNPKEKPHLNLSYWAVQGPNDPENKRGNSSRTCKCLTTLTTSLVE